VFGTHQQDQIILAIRVTGHSSASGVCWLHFHKETFETMVRLEKKIYNKRSKCIMLKQKSLQCNEILSTNRYAIIVLHMIRL
jgi:hypothetical protein